MSLVEKGEDLLSDQFKVVVEEDSDLRAGTMGVQGIIEGTSLAGKSFDTVSDDCRDAACDFLDEAEHLGLEAELRCIVDDDYLQVAVLLLKEASDGIVVVTAVEPVRRQRHNCANRLLLRVETPSAL